MSRVDSASPIRDAFHLRDAEGTFLLQAEPG